MSLIKDRKRIVKYILLLAQRPCLYWRRGKLSKAIIILITVVLTSTLGAFGIAQWYAAKERAIPLTYGATFVPDYATFLGLNPKQTLHALTSIGVRQFRLTSYWSDIEPNKGQFDFSQLDWEFAQADQVHAKIILTVGLRQPRWPECQVPNWVNISAPMSSWEPQLLQEMSLVINRYKHNPALQAYQLENEYFLHGFGKCTNYSRKRLITENNLVKKLDPAHPIIIGRSNNGLGFPLGLPKPSVYSISIYRRVYNPKIIPGYLEYPYTAWFYGFLAGTQEIYQHKNMIIGEMQAEAWTLPNVTIPESSLAEQNKSMNASRLEHRFSFSKQTGMKDVIMWGAEYWYYRMVVLHDPSLWNVAKSEYQANNYHDANYLFNHLNS